MSVSTTAAILQISLWRKQAGMLLDVRNLTKNFGSFRAVDDVSFSLARGEVVGLVGPNGAGKSTIVHMLLGLVTPTSGRIHAFGTPLSEHRRAILSRINFSSPYMAFPGRLTVRENLMIFARLYNTPDAKARVMELLRLFEIEHLRDKPVGRLSSGENTRVGLCKTFLNDPELVLMDEPTAFLDPRAARCVKQTVLELRERRSTGILYTSHNMADVEEMCTRVIFLSRGRVIAAGTPMEVTRDLLKDERREPALGEVFLRITTERSNEMA